MIVLRRFLVLTSLLLLAACTRDDPPPVPSAPPPPVEELRSTWPVRAALDERVDASLLQAVAQRWLGGSGAWSPPGSPPGGASPALAARWLREDAQGLRHLARVLAHATCRMAQDPGAFAGPVSAGYSVGARSCEDLGDTARAALATQHAGPEGLKPPAPPSDAGYGIAAARFAVELEGETLEYQFIEPAEFAAVVARLEAAAAALPPASAGAEADVGRFFAERAGTSDLLPEGQAATLEPASAIFAALAPGEGRQASAEVALDKILTRWTAGLHQLPAETDGGLDASGRGLLDGWVRKAYHREIGLLALDAGEPDLALVFLEDAAGQETRAQPAAGLDPVLLLALARARYESNELQRAVALLEDIGQVPGWEAARTAARMVARVAVLPSAAQAQVKR